MIGGALNALKFQCAQRDSLSELFLEEKIPYNQCKGKSPRDSERFYLALTRIKASSNGMRTDRSNPRKP